MSPFHFIHSVKRQASLAVLGFFVLPFCLGQPVDLILYNGGIATADPNDSVVEAMAVEEGRIVALGREEEVMKRRGPDTVLLDLEGDSALPGLIDSHTHPTGASMMEFDHAIPGMQSVQDVLNYVKKRAAVVPEGQWIVIQQVFITRLKERRYPSRAELDQAAPNHPVLFRTGPDASMNSLALKIFNIDKSFEAPPGSKIERNSSTQEPTGIVRGWGGIVRIPSIGKNPTEQDRYDRLLALLKDYNSVGITAIADRNASSSAMRLFQRIRDNGELTLRVALSRAVANKGSVEEIRNSIETIAREPLSGTKDPMLRTVGVKMFLDGGMLTGSAYMREPWGVSEIYGIDDPDYRGLRFIPEDKLAAAVKACVENNLQFTAHSVGDGAVHALIDAYRIAGRERDIRPTRPNITHCNFMSREAVDAMAKLGISADIQPAWLYLDTRTLSKQFSLERMRYFQPLRSLFEAGVTVGGGSDHMQKIGSLRSVNPYNPFLGMWIAITRNALDYEGALHPQESLSRLQAVRFYTINNARIMFLEKETGSLESGKAADFIVLDRNILECPVDEIKDAQVRRTYLSGDLVFQAE